MMPGENHSKTAGIASEAAGACQNCTSLQQNLNEYIAALIALKQKIIDSDHLLAEYQQKCDDLQEAERENKTLRCQLEQVLQKVSPLEHNEEQIKSSNAGLEVKASAVDIVQQSQLKHGKVKEECKKCYIAKKKHQSKLKRIEEVASKHIKNIKRLQHEKRIIERELKKIQKKQGEIQNKKTMKNAQTQVANDKSVVNLDKEKIRFLLKELWSCIDSSTESTDGGELMLERNLRKRMGSHSLNDCTPSLSQFSPSPLNCTFATMPESPVVEDRFCKKSTETHTSKVKGFPEDQAFHTVIPEKDWTVLQDLNDSCLINSDQEHDMEELLQIMNWAKPLPHLLSPLKLSPLTTKYVFGEFTDSSDNESSSGRVAVQNKETKCKILEKEPTYVQDQTNVLTEIVAENCTQNVDLEEKVTDCNKSQSEFCSIYKDKLVSAFEMETEKKDVEMSPVQIKVSLNYANDRSTSNVCTELNPAENGNNMYSLKSPNSFEEPSECHPHLDITVRKLSRINEVELLNTNSVGPVSSCSLEKNVSNEKHTKSSHVYNMPSATENHVHSTITNAEENLVHDNVTSSGNHLVCNNMTSSEENLGNNISSPSDNISDANFPVEKNTDNSRHDKNQSSDNLLLFNKPKVQFNEKNNDFEKLKDLKSLKDSVDTKMLDDKTSVNMEINFGFETVLSESSKYATDVLHEHTQMINQSNTIKIDNVDQENNLSENSDSKNIAFTSIKKLEDNNKNMCSDLQTYATQMEKAVESVHGANDFDNIGKCNVNEQNKTDLSETVNLCSSNAIVYTSASTEKEQAVGEVMQPANESHPTILLHKNSFLSDVTDALNADRCPNELGEKHVLTDIGMPLLSEEQNVSMDFTAGDKDSCKSMSPTKEFHTESDALEKTDCVYTSGTEILPEEYKVVSNLALEQQNLTLLHSESIKVKNETTEETDENLDASLDSSSEDNFVTRRVSYAKVHLNNFCNINKSCRSSLESNDEKICNVSLESNVTPCKSIITTPEEMDCAVDLLCVSEKGSISSNTENGIIKEQDSLVTGDIITIQENGKNDALNTIDLYSENTEKEVVTAKEFEQKEENLVSEDIQHKNTQQNCCNMMPNKARKTLPGKNLIWNFERPKDLDNLAIIAGKNKNGSENPFNRAAINKRKRPKLNGSQKVKYADKESNRQVLSQGKQCLQNILVGETVLANADTSTNSDHSPEMITKVRSEMGPPLPPLLGPLLATPPKSMLLQSPILSTSSCSSLPSPLNDPISPLPGTPFPQLMSPLPDRFRQKSPILTTPSPAENTNKRILSSPLQFCAATPKHALPVPGRLPLSAPSSTSSKVQENSVKILDTMYPELSARARTLNILKGNVQLNRSLPRDSKNVSVSQITGFKQITSTSTAFIKTGGNSKANNSEQNLNSCESQNQPSNINFPTSDAFLMPRSAKRLRLGTESPNVETTKNLSTAQRKSDKESFHNIGSCEALPDVVEDSSADEDIITKALKKIEDLCFDLLPVIRSHIYVGTIPKVPVMRNEEKEVIYEFSNSKKILADSFLQVVLKKIKTEKRSMATAYLQALCRVYVGLCRQLGDLERARVLCYSILKGEDFPDPDQLLLFIVSSWNEILSTHGVVSKAIQAVLKKLATKEVSPLLSAYLNWEKGPPMKVTVLLSSVVMAMQLSPDLKFQQSEKYGEDLTDNIWEYVFALDLLCSHQKWVWTHNNIISKELWPLLDKWAKRKKGNLGVSYVPDIIAAAVLRTVGYLCQMGLKEGFVTAVKNISAVILTLLQHSKEEGMCWGLQLACVYMLFDLSPSDPLTIYKALQAWKDSATNDIPPAVVSCMQELESMCGSQ